MMKKDESSRNNSKKTMLIESNVRITQAALFKDIDLSLQYHLIYLVDVNALAIFKGDQSKRNKTELPYLIIRTKSLINVNFTVSQRLNDLILYFHEENKMLNLRFPNESVKNEIGDKIKRSPKQTDKFEDNLDDSYSDIELKYKIAKILETMSFGLFKENYNYKKILELDYLNLYSEIYNIKSQTHKHVHNRLFFGKIAQIRKKSKLKREGIQSEEDRLLC